MLHSFTVQDPAGTGRSVALKFSKEGYKVALIARRLETSKSVEAEITKNGGEALSVAADTGRQSISVCFASITSKSTQPYLPIHANCFRAI